MKLSGNKATRNYSIKEAFDFYREAINVLNQLPATDQNKRKQIEVRLLISTPMHFLGWPEDSLQILQETEGLLKEIGDERSLSIFYSKLAVYYTSKGEPLSGIKYTEGPFREAEKIQDIELMAPIACELCTSYQFAGQHSRTIDVAPKVLALLEKTQRERDFFGTRWNVYSGLCAHCLYAFGMLGNFEEEKVLYEKGLHFAHEVHSLYALAALELLYGRSFNIGGNGKNAIDHLQESIRYTEEAQAVVLSSIAWAELGYGYYLLGELETSQKYIEKGIKILIDKDLIFVLSFQFCLLSMVHFDSGDLKNAKNCVREALRLSQNHNAKDTEGISKIWLGRILVKAETSQAGKWEEHILQGIKICNELKIKPFSAQGYLFLGELHADTGQREKALANLKKAEGMFQEMGMDYWLAQTQEVLGRL